MNEQTVSVPTNALQDIADDQFSMAVHQAAHILNRPEFNGRLEKAVQLVLSGGVTLHEDGTATVKSGNRKYYLEPDCTCEDSKRRSLYCKHFLAVQLLKRTYERMGQSSNGHHPEPQDTAVSTPWLTAQAPSSCTLKWAMGGIELMLTLRDATDDALFGRIQRVLPKIEHKMELQRQQRQQAQAEREQRQAEPQPQGNGNHDNPATSRQQEDEDHWCHYHNAPLWRYEKNGQVWYSHRADDGKWCRGK